jgi:osmotically-inducible protein OsmY
MAERHGHRDWHREERGFTDRARDEVRSWFGDEDAERRRRLDERERDTRYSGQGRSYDEGWASPRNWRDDTSRRTLDEGRIEYAPPRRDLQRHAPGYEPERSFDNAYDQWSGYETRSEPRWRGESSDEHRRPGETRGYYEDDRGRTFEFDHRGEQTFVGRGPKGYRRSDERIREDVCDRLADDPHVDASEIDVVVKDGEVTLSGTVHERLAKRRSEDLAAMISGVRDVQNHLRIARQAEPASPGTTSKPPRPSGL